MKNNFSQKYPMTFSIRKKHLYVIALIEAESSMFKATFWNRKILVEEKLKFIQEKSIARAELFEAVEKEYPQLKGKWYDVNSTYIKENPMTTSK